MSLRQTPPGKGGRSGHVHFVHVKTPNGKKWQAHIAGKCHWYECHTKGRSKPCVHWMTDGELLCDLCSPFNIAQTIGYQPLYKYQDGRPGFVVVHDYNRDHVDALKLHHPVYVSRGDEASDTISLTPLLSQGVLYKSSVAARMEPQDLTESLLRIWGLPHLTEWYRQTHGGRVTLPPAGAPLPNESRLPNGNYELKDIMARHAVRKAGYEPPEVLSSELTNEIVETAAAKNAKFVAESRAKPKK